MNISPGRMLLPIIEGRIRKKSNNSDRFLHFLASNKNTQKILFRFIKSKACGRIITSVCREAVKKYEHVNFEDAFQWIKDYRNFSEDTKINALNEIYDRSSKRERTNWLSEILGELDSEEKARLLKRIFYNIILIGLKRKIINIRLKGYEQRVPNLSTLLLATSSKCNLRCTNCESDAERNDGEASYEQINYIIRQAKRLNIFHVVITGKGEPFCDDSSKRILFRLMKKHWDINFILFTNATTLRESDIAAMKDIDNLFTLVSIDGLEKTNDYRRGKGVYKVIIETFEIMKRYKLLYGYSSTVFKENYRHVLSGEFLSKMMEMGCKTGIYLMFIPVDENSNGNMMLDEDEVREYRTLYGKAKENILIPILDPEIFEQINGCRSKRGSLIYIDATNGKVMPCVKTPYSPEECNIYLDPHKDRLLEILKTEFFTNHRDSSTGCNQCSLNLPKELNQYLLDPGISPRDREKAGLYLGKVVNAEKT